MKSRVTLTTLAVVVACALSVAASAETRTGRCDVLLDAHAYNTGSGVVVPLRPIAEWMGAEVEYRAPVVEVRLGRRVVSLKVGARQATVNGQVKKLATPAKVYGSVLCVPVRFVAEALGCEVEYMSEGSQVEVTGYIDHVLVSGGGNQARVLVHSVPPDVTAAIIAAHEREAGDEGRGFDYLIGVTRRAGDWAKAHQPDWWDDYGFGQHWRTGFYHRTGSGWEFVSSSSRVSYARDDLERMGIPVEVARALGSEIEE